MAFNRDGAIAGVRFRIQDQATRNANLTDADIEAAILSALSDFSRNQEAVLIAEFAGNGTSYYALLTALPSWSDGLSSIRNVQYPAPVFSTNDAPSPLDDTAGWSIQDDLVANVRVQYLYFTNNTPLATEQVRVTYTGLHTLSGLSGSTSTTIRRDEWGVRFPHPR